MLSSATKESAKITKELAQHDLKNAAYDANDKASQAVESLSEYAHKAGRNVRHYLDNAGDELSQMGEKVSSEIRNHPVRSSLIALAAGFVLGAIARR